MHTFLGIIKAGKKWQFWPKSIIFLDIIKPADSAFWFSALGVCVMTLLLMCSINIFNYLFEQVTQTVQQKARFSRKSETKVKDKVIIF